MKNFWSKVNIKPINECWEWLGAKNNNGYGMICVCYTNNLAHRLSWELHNKREIPKGKCILHKCDNKSCVNPHHLYCGTQGDNMSDRESRNPVSKTICGLGKAKLRSGEIWLIRRLRKFPSGIVCKMFNVGATTIKKIWRNDKYLCREGYYI